MQCYFNLGMYILLAWINAWIVVHLLTLLFGKKLRTLPLTHIVYYTVRDSRLKFLIYWLLVYLWVTPFYLYWYICNHHLFTMLHYRGFFLFFIPLLATCYYAYFDTQVIILHHPSFRNLRDKFSDKGITNIQVWAIRFIILLSFVNLIYFPDAYLTLLSRHG